MLNKKLYPKTARLKEGRKEIVITEKLDGSNLGIFRLNDELVIAQRNWVFTASELTPDLAYVGLLEWIQEHGETLLNNMRNGSGFFGEWIGMGKIKYGDTLDNIKLYMFAKANIDENYNITNLFYTKRLFIYTFIDQVIPEFIGVVKTVATLDKYPSIAELDAIYDEYVQEAGRKVEGFVINDNNEVTKYVRFKNGKETPHVEGYGKGE